MADDKLLRIGELSKRVNVTPRTIRFYVQEKLLPDPVRTHKNMALYNKDCIEKIRAIKKAQSEKFLPLMVIRKILEKNNYDYSFLTGPTEISEGEADNGGGETPVHLTKTEFDVPGQILDEMIQRGWIQPDERDKGNTPAFQDRQMLSLLEQLNQNGIACDKILQVFNAIQELVEQAAGLEIETLLSWIIKNPTINFNDTFQLEESTIHNFIKNVRKRYIAKYIHSYKRTLDNAYFASSDEGFALSLDEIVTDLKILEDKIDPRNPDIKVLNSLATGYSCVGDLKQSRSILSRVLTVVPDNLEAKIRWHWYNRFIKDKEDNGTKQLAAIVRDHSDFAVGHAFLAFHHALDILDSDKSRKILKTVNLCLYELDLAVQGKPENLHHWTVIHYAEGRILTLIHSMFSQQDKAISAFESIMDRKSELDEYYSKEMPFFPKWLWPNLYFFLGASYLQVSKYQEALDILRRCRKSNMFPPFHENIEIQIKNAKAGLASTKNSQLFLSQV